MTAAPRNARTYALAGGGTGGHAYPSLTVGEELRARGNALVFYGSDHGPERALAEAAGIRYRPFPASQVRGGPKRMLMGGVNLLRGRRAAAQALRADRPAALFATGGYAAAPVGWAAPSARVPLLVFPWIIDIHNGVCENFPGRLLITPEPPDDFGLRERASDAPEDDGQPEGGAP